MDTSTQETMGTDRKQQVAVQEDPMLGSRLALYAPAMLAARRGDMTAAASGSAAATQLAGLLKRHRKAPDIPSLTELPRSVVPVSELSEQTLRDAGFVPSYIAVPEIGQTELRTWRHPFSGMHFHRHGGDWRFHVDTYSSWQMLKRKAKLLRAAGIDAQDPSVWEAAKHVLQEGLPGYVSYANGVILGNRRLGVDDARSAVQRAPRAAAGALGAAALLSLASRGASGEWKPLQSASAVGALLGTTHLAKSLYTHGVGKGWFGKRPSWSSMALLGAAPLAAAGGAYALTNALLKRRKKRQDQRPEDEQEA